MFKAPSAGWDRTEVPPQGGDSHGREVWQVRFAIISPEGLRGKRSSQIFLYNAIERDQSRKEKLFLKRPVAKHFLYVSKGTPS